MGKAILIIVLAAVFGFVVKQDRVSLTMNTFHVQGLDNVVLAELIPAHAGGGAFAMPLDLNKPSNIEMLSKVLNWINQTVVEGNAKDQLVSNGGNPTQLRIVFQSGDVITVEDAIGTSAPKKLANGIEIHSTAVPDQVTVYQNNVARRINAPKLKAWIEEGWQQEEPFTFTSVQAILKVVKEHPEFPATGEKQISEDIGGVEQPVTLTTKVEKRGQMAYTVTLTKDYNLLVSGKEAMQYWVYSVDPSNATLIDRKGEAPSIK